MDDQEAIDDDEIIYRRIPVSQSWYDLILGQVKPDAFKPTKRDITGISVSRSKSTKNLFFSSAEEAAQGPSSKGYYVASLRVGNLRAHGVSVVAKPLPEIQGHAEISNLTYGKRKEPDSLSLMVLLAHKLVDAVEGPFPKSPH